MQRKGIALAAAPAVVMMFVILSVVSIVGININEQFKQDSSFYTVGTKMNESVTWSANGTYKGLTNPYAIDIVEIRNSTDVMYNTSSQYSSNATLLSNYSASSIRMHWTSGIAGDVYYVGAYSVWYHYYVPTDSLLASVNSTNGIQQITQNQELIGIVVIMAIVVGILLASFAFRPEGSL